MGKSLQRIALPQGFKRILCIVLTSLEYFMISLDRMTFARRYLMEVERDWKRKRQRDSKREGETEK